MVIILFLYNSVERKRSFYLFSLSSLIDNIFREVFVMKDAVLNFANFILFKVLSSLSFSSFFFFPSPLALK